MLMACGMFQRLSSDRPAWCDGRTAAGSGPQQEHQRKKNDEIADAQIKHGVAPAELGNQQPANIRHDALTDGAAGGDDADRQPLALR